MTVHRLWTALAMGEDAADRMLRRYADCMADPNTTLHRRTVSNAVGFVPLGAEAMEAGLRAQLERGEATMKGIKADHARYCG